MVEVASIEILGFVFLEPITLLTDLCLGLFCLFFWKKLKNFSEDAITDFAWRKFFLFLGIASCLGGFAHFLFLYTGIVLHLITWSFVILSMYYIEKRAVFYMPLKLRKIFLLLARSKAIIFLALVFFIQSFEIVLIHTVIALSLLVFLVHFYHGIKYKNKSSRLVVFAVVLSALSTLFLSPDYAFNEWFTHKDLVHLILVICMWIFYLAGKNDILDVENKETNNSIKINN